MTNKEYLISETRKFFKTGGSEYPDLTGIETKTTKEVMWLLFSLTFAGFFVFSAIIPAI